LQSDQQLFDFVELHVITGEARDMMRKHIARCTHIRNVMLQGHPADTDSGSALGLRGHGFSSFQYSISSSENPLNTTERNVQSMGSGKRKTVQRNRPPRGEFDLRIERSKNDGPQIRIPDLPLRGNPE
jgi:hypothetical protein